MPSTALVSSKPSKHVCDSSCNRYSSITFSGSNVKIRCQLSRFGSNELTLFYFSPFAFVLYFQMHTDLQNSWPCMCSLLSANETENFN